MKASIFFMVLLFSNVAAQNKNVQQLHSQNIEKRIMKAAQIGQLICSDDYGNYTICTGNEFEKILGFCTNVPYITVNKAKGDNMITEHQGIASFEKGKIKVGDYLCPCTKNPGQVVRCKKRQHPYAKALEAPSSSGNLFKVKILGHRRKY